MSDSNTYIWREIQEHREFQDSKWGVKDHPTGMGHPFYKDLSYRAKENVHRKFKQKQGTWYDLITEEFFEAGAESDYLPCREELIQLAATVVACIESMDRQEAAKEFAEREGI